METQHGVRCVMLTYICRYETQYGGTVGLLQSDSHGTNIYRYLLSLSGRTVLAGNAMIGCAS
jgi:hypothetical protein